ncbi:MAG: hypothetical protein U1E45_07750 [Geminicoccaceae bacterium]
MSHSILSDAYQHVYLYPFLGERVMPRKDFRSALLASGALILLLAAGPAWAQATTERVSVGPGGIEANDFTVGHGLGLSATGRYAVFESSATNLATAPIGKYFDVYVRDRNDGTNQLVSRTWNGRRPDGSSGDGIITPDGRFVAFASTSTNLVRGDTNFLGDIFVRNLRTGKTERVSVASDGHEGNGESYGPSISADGRFVAFYSIASNLVSGDTNGGTDTFVHDRQTGTTVRVDLGPGRAQSNGGHDSFAWQRTVMSADGRFVGFISSATNLVPNDTNGVVDVFVRDRLRGTTELISRGAGNRADGESFVPSISANGRFVAFMSRATNLVRGDTNGYYDIFVRDRLTQTTRRVSVGAGGVQANGFCGDPFISADGQVVAYQSDATNLVAGDRNGLIDIFVSATSGGKTERVSVTANGQEANDESTGQPALSARGRIVLFASEGTNLVPGDANGVADAFVRVRSP